MEKKLKTKVQGISLIAIGSLIILTIIGIIVTWKLVAILIGIGGGTYLIRLGTDRLKQSNQSGN